MGSNIRTGRERQADIGKGLIMSRCFAIKSLQTESFDQSDLTALKWLSLHDHSRRTYLTQTQTIDLGSLRLEDDEAAKLDKTRSEEAMFHGVKIIQKKECWSRTSGKRRHSSNVLRSRRCQSMELDDQPSDEEHQPKIMRLQSEADLQDFPDLKKFESEEIDIADIYMKVPVQT